MRTRAILPPNPTLPVPKCIRTISGNHTFEGFMLLRYDFSDIYKIGLSAENTMVGWGSSFKREEEAKKTFRSGRIFYVGICTTRLGIRIFGSDFWDPHWRQNSGSVNDSEDSGRIFFLKFRFLESQKIGIPICDFRNSGNFLHRNLVLLFVANLY